MLMGNVRCIAVDWSGAADARDQLAHISFAIAEGGHLIRLRNGLTRVEVIDLVLEEFEREGPLFIGLDFAFSFPQWYLEHRRRGNVLALWNLVATDGEQWLEGQTWPFWGLPGPYQRRPETLTPEMEFRHTDEALRLLGYQPFSVFQMNGVGSVGKQSVRGIPELIRLRDAGAAIWPFDAPVPGRPVVIELYPRVLYGRAVINNGAVAGRDSRQNYLNNIYAHLEQHWRDNMTGSADAFDAGVSALVMSAHAGDLQGLHQAADPRELLEGNIWMPQMPQ